MENLNKYGFLSVDMIGVLIIVLTGFFVKGYLLLFVQMIGFCLLSYGIYLRFKKQKEDKKESESTEE